MKQKNQPPTVRVARIEMKAAERVVPLSIKQQVAEGIEADEESRRSLASSMAMGRQRADPSQGNERASRRRQGR